MKATSDPDTIVGTRCAACGAVWSNDAQIDTLSDAVEPYQRRAWAAEKQLKTARATLGYGLLAFVLTLAYFAHVHSDATADRAKAGQR